MRSFKASPAPPTECPPGSIPPSTFKCLSSFLFFVLLVIRFPSPTPAHSHPCWRLPLVRSPMGTSCQA